MTFLLSLDLQYTKGLAPEQAGLILIIKPAIMAIISLVTGRLPDMIDPHIIAFIGMVLTAFGLMMFVFVAESTLLWYISASLAMIGVGLGRFSSPNQDAIMSPIEKQYYGVASSIKGSMS